MMTKKDYKKFADVLAKAYSDYPSKRSIAGCVIDSINHDLCALFAKDDPNFDETKFQATAHGHSPDEK